ncbi:MAG: hypothetical protein H0W50_00710 [Parachlamydiaceae bacterium]|nr:hypothetical protein [Parachlamydiaceae bacterium]
MLFRSTSILSVLSISSLFLGGIYAYQQDERQPLGQRGNFQTTEARQPLGERGGIVVAQPGRTSEPEQALIKMAVPEKKKKEHKKNKKKDKSRDQIGEKGQGASPLHAMPVVVAQPRQQERPVVVNTPVMIKEKKHKKDKSRQTLGERSDRNDISDRQPIMVAQPRQEIGPQSQLSIQRPLSLPQSRQVITPLEKGPRQVIGERARPMQNAPVVGLRQPIGVNSPVVVPTPLQRSERPAISVGFQMGNAVVAQPQRPVIVPRPMPQVIVIDRNSAIYPSAVLTPYFISRRGDSLQLDNGSSWNVRPRDRKIVRKWDNGDAIVIETGRFFSWSTYKLVNYTRGVSVDVELNDAVCNGMLSHWVAEINPFEGYLRLQDGSVWRMSTHELLNWQVNDDVIIALSKNFFSNNSSYVLINPRVKSRLVAVFSL